MGEARKVAEQFYDSFGKGDFGAAIGLFADRCVTVTPAGSLNNAEHKAFGEAFKNALPDAHMKIVRAVESGNEVFVSGRFLGKHTGDMVSPQGTIPASGNQL